MWYSMFDVLKNCFPELCTNLRSQQQCMKVLVSPHHRCQYLSFLLIAILMGMKGYFIAVLICISIMTNIVEHLSMYFLAISILPLEKCLDPFVTLTLHFPLLPAFHSLGPNPVCRKACDKIQYPFIIKTQQTTKRREISQPDKRHL